jgi:Sucrase/ferredoxin-like
MAAARPFCAEMSRHVAEPLAATASRVDHWILLEYRGLWGYDALASSGLDDAVKRHLRAQVRARRLTKLLFVRRTERRHHGRLAVYWGSSPERGGRVYGAEITRYDDLLALDFAGPGETVDHPLLLACTHGKHDRCCARYGRPLYAALRDGLEEEWVWQASHVGGDRFAGNLVVLPEGLYFGRVGAADAWTVLEDYLARRVRLEHYRGRCCYSFPVQAAERRIRADAGITGIDELCLRDARREEPGWRVRFSTTAGRAYEVAVAVEPGELTHLTCGDDGLTRPPRYVAEILRVSTA